MTFDQHILPTPDVVRSNGWSGDVTRFPLTLRGVLKRCTANGITLEQVPNSGWYYAPNAYVQKELNDADT